MSPKSIIICDFTHIYREQPFMDSLFQSKGTHVIDCSSISGTDCYCDDEALATIKAKIQASGIVTPYGIHFIDNGNYHYMSKIWTDLISEPFSLVVFDHHPDMQPPRFGDILSCGGWIEATIKQNEFIQNAYIIGVADQLAHQEHPENTFIIKESELASFTISQMQSLHQNIYLSIDKDVLSVVDAATNWDQGSLRLAQMQEFIQELSLSHNILGVDICGERSTNFDGDENHSVQEADEINNALNQQLLNFLVKVLHPNNVEVD